MKKPNLFLITCAMILAMVACSADNAMDDNTGSISDGLYANNGEFDIVDLMYQYHFVRKDIPMTFDELKRIQGIDDEDNGPYVMKKDEKLVVTNFMKYPKHLFVVYDGDEIGHIVSVDQGISNRYLYYVSVYGGDDFYEINTIADDFYILNGNEDIIYCVHGVAHIFTSEGKITRIMKVGGKWQRDESFEIDFGDDCIRTFYYDYEKKDVVYVVTDKKIVKIKGDKIEKVLLEDAFWKSMLSPSSIVKIGETLYIGMCGGIASYNLESGELLWYEETAKND